MIFLQILILPGNRMGLKLCLSPTGAITLKVNLVV